MPRFSAVPRPLLLAFVVASLAACNRPQTPASGSPGANTQAEAVVTPAPASETGPAAPAAPTVLTEQDEAARTQVSRASGWCNIDKVGGTLFPDGTATIADPAAFQLEGWLGDKGSMSRPEGAMLRLDAADGAHSWVIGIGPAVSRQDVAKHFQAPGLANSGFLLSADLSALPPGEYSLSLRYPSGNSVISCDKGRRISIHG
jgi:hypothetical protein